jgi:hypothetical protein
MNGIDKIRNYVENLKRLNVGITESTQNCIFLLSEVDRLNAECASREQSNIDEHNDVHYWRDRAKVAEKDIDRLTAERDAAVKEIQRSCHNCKHWKPLAKRTCAAPGKSPCDIWRREAWEWRGITEVK